MWVFDQVAIGRLDLTIPNSGLGLHEHLPITHWCCDQHGTCGWLMAIGSRVWNPSFNKLWPGSWRQIRLVTFCMSIFGKVFSCIPWGPQSHTLNSQVVYCPMLSVFLDYWINAAELLRTFLELNYMYTVIWFPQLTLNWLCIQGLSTILTSIE